MKKSISRLVRNLLHATPLKSALQHRYEYFFWPRELNFLCEQIAASLDVPGSFLEVGCARGATSVFLNKHLDCLERWDGITPIDKTYYCLDTFSGFVDSHVEHERKEGFHRDENYTEFDLNDEKWFKFMLVQNEVTRTRVIKADAAAFDYSAIGPFCFVLLDVDLYLAIAGALPGIYEQLSPGGVLIVDDCQSNGRYDGARQAYVEFVKSIGEPEHYEHRKFGMIFKK
jgi:O-methyltransferase